LELDLSIKDLTRVMYHIENSEKTTDDAIYKARYERLVSDLKSIGFTFEDMSSESIIHFNKEQDQKLKWKIQLMIDAKFEEQLEEEE